MFHRNTREVGEKAIGERSGILCAIRLPSFSPETKSFYMHIDYCCAKHLGKVLSYWCSHFATWNKAHRFVCECRLLLILIRQESPIIGSVIGSITNDAEVFLDIFVRAKIEGSVDSETTSTQLRFLGGANDSVVPFGYCVCLFSPCASGRG